MSLVIAIGLVVDNAIVVLENITQHIEKGADPKQAAIFGTSEMGHGYYCINGNNAGGISPAPFYGGIVGIMLKQLAFLRSSA